MSDDERRPPRLPPTVAPPARDPRRQTGRGREVVHQAPSTTVQVKRESLHLREVTDFEVQFETIAMRVLEGLIASPEFAEKVSGIVDERIAYRLGGMSDRIDEIADAQKVIADQQGADVDRRVQLAEREAYYKARDEFEKRERERDTHVVTIRNERWKVYLSLGGTVTALIVALIAALASNCRH